jgi:DNA-directed RNA polymerase specialized sigma24 family protein
MGYDVESEDETKQTAATICGVTGRTIFNRLTRAAEKLSQFKEEL